MNEFANKVAVITGDANGIGKCIADEFLKQGAVVCVIDKADGDHFVGDISDRETLERFAEHVIAQHGHIDYLINNALPLMKSIQEKGFDRTLDEFSDTSRAAKELLLSESTVDFVIGMVYLDTMLNDGGHRKLFLSAMMDSRNFTASETALVLAGIMQDPSSPYSQLITEHFTNSMTEVLKPTVGPTKARDVAYAAYEIVREWNAQGIRLLRYEDTCVFVFNSFMRDDAEPFIWSLNYAQDNGCKNFVLDITANAGGHETILLYMMAVISGQDKLQCICTLTGNTMETEAKYDRNFDGVFDERDDAVKYDLNFAVMATKASSPAAI